MSSKAYIELVFVSVTETSTAPKGRAGLQYKTSLAGFGFTGGTSADADSDANVDLGYIGGFPDGKAPLPGSGMYIAFNPVASCSEEGNAMGIGNLILSMVLTDTTAGQSTWSITARLQARITVETTSPTGGMNTVYWSTLAGFDVTDFDSAYEFNLLYENGRQTNFSYSKVSQPLTLHLQIRGRPDADPAEAVVNLKTEAEASVRVGPLLEPPDGDHGPPELVLPDRK
ncbi:MAG: hypothetical protein AMXMBFR58_05190 [Phycisphaerae bacterium]|nr:hypothetical protein [Phycisphaerales bacterium]MCK6477276.1 hypothetical protein [Phycisphaerales bacterium]